MTGQETCAVRLAMPSSTTEKYLNTQISHKYDKVMRESGKAKHLLRNCLKFANGYALVVVAGMNYAEFVEAMENKNVLASAELFARKELPGMMSKLKSNLHHDEV